jgi:hypothetical protein
MKNILLIMMYVSARLYAADWSFAVVADPRSDGTTWKAAVAEIRDMKTSTTLGACQFTICCGDQDPASSRISDYKSVMGTRASSVPLLPVMGNHDTEENTILTTHIRAISGAQVKNNCSYYLDNANVRIIVVDAYNTFGSGGCVNAAGYDWVKSLIEAPPGSIEHIFVALHDPAFPRVRHVGDSFDACKTDRDKFWKLLVANKAKVRAVFVGHTHSYYRMQVADPASTCANSSSCYPQESGGIYQVDAGAAGNGSKNTVVFVQIGSQGVRYRVVQASDGGSTAFAVIDEWGDRPVGVNSHIAESIGTHKKSNHVKAILDACASPESKGTKLIDGRVVPENKSKASGIVVD